jgi:hypothetical protein
MLSTLCWLREHPNHALVKFVAEQLLKTLLGKVVRLVQPDHAPEKVTPDRKSSAGNDVRLVQ